MRKKAKDKHKVGGRGAEVALNLRSLPPASPVSVLLCGGRGADCCTLSSSPRAARATPVLPGSCTRLSQGAWELGACTPSLRAKGTGEADFELRLRDQPG